MIIVSGTLVIDPSKADRIRELCGPLCEATRQEPGNHSYEYFAALDDPGRYHVYEEWETEEHLATHLTMPHIATFGKGMAELGVTRAEFMKHHVSSSAPLRP